MILWLFLAMSLAVYLLIKEIYKKYWDKNLKIEVFLPKENVHAGEKSKILEVITNNKFLPLPILETRFYLEKGIIYKNMLNSSISDKLYRRDVFFVGGNRKISRSFEIECQKRGYYTLDNIDTVSYDLFLTRKVLGKHTCFRDFYVYPRKVKTDKIAPLYRKIMGDITSSQRVYEDPFSFSGIREYLPGDSISKVNWKATAKSTELLVNIYDSAISQKVYIFLDTYENKKSYSEYLNEESIKIASALLERMIYQGIDVTLVANGRDIVSNEVLSFVGVKNIGTIGLKKHLSRIEMGFEEEIYNYFIDIPKNAYSIIISKNVEIEQEISKKFDEYTWIVPYRAEKPEIDINHCPWELEMQDVSLEVNV